MTDVAGRTALVTGAAHGMGRLLALELARRGARLVLWDIDEQPMEIVAKEIESAGGTCAAYRCDVGDRADVQNTATRVWADVGPVDVLVNNAGVVHGKLLLDLSDEEIEEIFRVNALAHFWTTRAFLPAMVERGTGHVVTMSSVIGLAGSPRLVDYTATKSAVIGFTHALRLELARTAPRVRTTVVLPYYVSTGMFEGARSRFPRLFPILGPETVARRIAQAIRRDEERVMTPPIGHIARFLEVLPTQVCDEFLQLAGFNASMDRFVGRRGR